MDLRPVDLPELRDETAEFVLRTGPELYERAIRDGRQQMKPLASPTRAAQILAAAEVSRLKQGELFFVTSEMADLAIAAGATLPDFNLMPEDLPSPSGMIFFEKEIAAVDYSEWYEAEGRSPIVAASWSPWDGGNDRWVHGGIWITWYSDREAILQSGISRKIYTQRQIAEMRPGLGRLLIDNESQCPFSPVPLPISDDGSNEKSLRDATGIIRWLAVLKSAWLLMAQPIASVREAVYDRAARRRIEKRGKEPPRVRVITLRRPASSGSGESDREYHHQWIVRGHWRQQWYPSRGTHRPVWIAPHIKGPEGAPLLGGEKVYAWAR